MMPGAEACRCLFADRRRWKNPGALGVLQDGPQPFPSIPMPWDQGDTEEGGVQGDTAHPHGALLHVGLPEMAEGEER